MLQSRNALLTLTLFLLALAANAGAAQPGPCASDPQRRQLDFLIGTWDVRGSDGTSSQSTIESTLGGCALTEHGRSAEGAEVRGLFHYDPADEQWHLIWVDSTGQSFFMQGAASGDAIELRGVMSDADGGQQRLRATWSRLAGGGVRQVWEESSDGSSWEPLWTGEYRPAGEPPRSTRSESARPTRRERRASRRAAPEEATEVRRSGDVEARTVAPPETPEPRDEAPAVAALTPEDTTNNPDQIRMESPMQLQLPIGPVEKLPEGYGWSSSETAAYRVGPVTLRKVEIERTSRKGQVALAIDLDMHSTAFSTQTEVHIELLDAAGTAHAEADLGRFPLGKGLPHQSQYGFVTKSARLEVSRELFERLFATADERPQLRVTVAVASTTR